MGRSRGGEAAPSLSEPLGANCLLRSGADRILRLQLLPCWGQRHGGIRSPLQPAARRRRPRPTVAVRDLVCLRPACPQPPGWALRAPRCGVLADVV